MSLFKIIGEQIPVAYQASKLYEVGSNITNSTSIVSVSKHSIRLIAKSC